MHACKVVFVIHQFMGCLSILLWPKLFPSMAYDGFQNSLHWKTRWFSLQRGKRLVALGWFQTLADCKSTTKLVVFRLVINHSSCPCIFIFVFCLCLKNYFPTEIQFCFCVHDLCSCPLALVVARHAPGIQCASNSP